MRIRKAKIKDAQLHVTLEEGENDTEKTSKLASLEGFHPDLAAAFAALCGPVREILEWPEGQYADALNITSVSWTVSETSGIEGAVISGHALLEGSKRAFNFNTPFLPFDQMGESEAAVMPKAAQEALNALKAEVRAYIEGKRNQGDLFQEAA